MSDPNREVTEGPLLRIGELSRRTGVRADTLRAWERRYGLLTPARSDGGFRLYTSEDARRVSAMRSLIDSGLSAAEAARVARSQNPAPQPVLEGSSASQADRRLREALERFDEAEAHAVLDGAIAALSIEALADLVVLPALEELGDRWREGVASVGQEHYATNIVRGRLAGLARNWGAGRGPLALLACPPGELHDVGLLVFGLILRSRGWRIAYLGADTPIETVADAADQLHPRVVVLAALTDEPFRSAAGAIAELGKRVHVLLAGAGADAGLARLADAELLGDDPVTAARHLAERSS